MSSDQIAQLASVLAELQMRTEGTRLGVENSLTCENPKLMEVLSEHLVLNWDAIGEELLGEEIDRL